MTLLNEHIAASFKKNSEKCQLEKNQSEKNQKDRKQKKMKATKRGDITHPSNKGNIHH